MRSPVNTANGHFLKFTTSVILYNLTPLVRPLEKAKTPVTFSLNDLCHLLIKQPVFSIFIIVHKSVATSAVSVSYNEVLWLNKLQSRVKPWQSVFVIKVWFFSLAVCFFVCGSL